MTISIRDIKKKFGRYPALNKVGLEIHDGELLALLGPSGSGKTTLLRVIAGLDFPDEGQIYFGEDDVTHAGAAKRRVGFVFQQYALFKHMSVARNVAFGLDVRKGGDKPSRPVINGRVEELLKLVELDGLGKRYPNQLSGGQRQRVALARALAVDPKVLLLDEPFGALDATVRKSLRRELRRIHDATKVTTIFVTHDQEEALELADRVAILNKGVIEQVGTPDDVLDRPGTPFVCGFVGEANRFEGVVKGGAFRAGEVSLAAEGVPDGPAQAFVRPHQLAIAGASSGFEVVVERLNMQGAIGKLEGRTRDGRKVEFAFDRGQFARLGEARTVRLTGSQAYFFPA